MRKQPDRVSNLEKLSNIFLKDIEDYLVDNTFTDYDKKRIKEIFTRHASILITPLPIEKKRVPTIPIREKLATFKPNIVPKEVIMDYIRDKSKLEDFDTNFTQQREYVIPRYISMYLLYKYTNLSLTNIASMFRGRYYEKKNQGKPKHHSTILYGVRKGLMYIQESPVYNQWNKEFETLNIVNHEHRNNGTDTGGVIGNAGVLGVAI